MICFKGEGEEPQEFHAKKPGGFFGFSVIVNESEGWRIQAAPGLAPPRALDDE